MILFDNPAQLRMASNLAHWSEGGLLLALVIVALLEARGGLARGVGRFLWPGVITGAGIFLFAFMLLRLGLGNVGVAWNQILRDQQQIEHLWIAAILITAGVVEVLLRAALLQSRLWGLAIPLALVLIGLLLLVHTQYGTQEAIGQAKLQHRIQGFFLFLSGFTKGVDVLWPSRPGWRSVLWILFLFGSSVFLLTYREPPGSYEPRRKSHRPMRGPCGPAPLDLQQYLDQKTGIAAMEAGAGPPASATHCGGMLPT